MVAHRNSRTSIDNVIEDGADVEVEEEVVIDTIIEDVKHGQPVQDDKAGVSKLIENFVVKANSPKQVDEAKSLAKSVIGGLIHQKAETKI